MATSVDPERLEKTGFSMVRRGADPAEVRSALAEAADGLRLLQRRVHELEHEIETLEAQVPDPGTVVAEREAARSEGLAAGAAEAEAVRAAAREAADELLAEAKDQGRALVQEAQTVRRRMLDDLARRRRTMRQQIEQLQAGRERLLEAYEVVGHTMREATEELTAALPEARAAAERAGHGVPAQETVEQLEAEIEAARVAGLPIVGPGRPAPAPAEPPAARRRPVSVPLERDVRDMPEVEPVVAEFEGVRLLGDGADGDSTPGGVDAPAQAVVDGADASAPAAGTDAGDEVDDAPGAGGDVAPVATDDPDAGPEIEPESELTDDPDAGPGIEPESELTDDPDAGPGIEPESELIDDPDAGPGIEPESELIDDPDAEPGPTVGEDGTDLFSRLREATTVDEAATDDDAVPAAGADAPGDGGEEDGGESTETDRFDHPDDATEPFGLALGVQAESEPTDGATGRITAEQELARRLKRLLSDEQNDVLDRLRRTRKRTLELDDVLDDLDLRVSRFSVAVLPVLIDAAESELGSAAGPVDDLAAELAREVAEAIADGVVERLEEELEIDALSGPVRRLYREWKTERIGGLAHRYVDAACAPLSDDR